MKKLSKLKFNQLSERMPIIRSEELGKIIGGGSGTSADPFTESEFDSMMEDGSWSGGYVADWGFVGSSTTVFGYNGAQYYAYYTNPIDYAKNEEKWYDELAKNIIDEVPFLSEMQEYERDIRYALTLKLYEMGLKADAPVYVSYTKSASHDKNDLGTVRVYDGPSGRLLVSLDTSVMQNIIHAATGDVGEPY